jgi:arginase family enzyme
MFIVKVPGINGSNNTKGCEKAGNEILRVLKEEIYSNESGKYIEMDRLDLEEIHLDNSNLDTTNKLIYKNALEIFDSKPKTFFLGGDHSISYSLTKAFLDNCKSIKKEPCLIVFDAHPDCMPVTKGTISPQIMKNGLEL